MIFNFVRKHAVVIFVILVGIFASRDMLIPGYFPMHDDLQMMRQLQMDKCFRDGQIPCRWVADMGYGYGFPLFNFYPPLPYLVGEVIKTVGFPFTATVRITFLLSIVLSGVTMYFLAREFWGKLGGVVSSVFYIWAPYHAVDVFVRGAMNESWALVWFPLIFLASYKLLSAEGSKITRWLIVLSLSWAALLLSHNVMVLIFTPLFAFWCFLWVLRKKSWKRIPKLIISGIWALGLAAFFSIPVFFEQKYVHIETLTQGFYEYFAHFVSVNQLFLSRFWDYGASLWGPIDEMAFPIGHFHWILALVIFIAWISRLVFKKERNFDLSLVVLLLVFAGFFTAFMTHSRSTPIWQALPFLSILQFPWRFLTIVIFAFSFLAGAIVIILNSWNKKLARGLVVLLVFSVVLWNFEFFRVERTGPVTDQEKFSGEAWRLQQTAGIYDYLPKTATIAPQSPRSDAVEIVSGSAVIKEVKQGTNWLETKVNIDSLDSTVRINIFQFPGWRVFVDGKEKEIRLLKDDQLGRIHVDVPQGEHNIEVRLFNTTPRTIGNTLSAISWLALITFPKWRKKLSL